MLENRVAIVTGGGRGIGRIITLDLAAHGAKIVVNYHQNATAAQETVAAIVENGGDAIAAQADVRSGEAAQKLIKTATDTFGQVDILVNNAGITRDQIILRLSEDDWDAVLDTNLKSVFHCSKAVLRPMLRRRKGGRIINISSVVAHLGLAGQTNYTAAKAGLEGLTRSLAREVGSRQITVNAVAPGFIPTDMTAAMPEHMVEWVQQNTPLGRLGNPQDVAHLVTFLASDRAAYITGQTIHVDGGLAMK